MSVIKRERNQQSYARSSVIVVVYSDEKKKKKKVCRTFEKNYQLKTAEETV